MALTPLRFAGVLVWPNWLLPHVTTVPSPLSAMQNQPPPAIVVTPFKAAGTFVSPCVLLPQTKTVLSFLNAIKQSQQAAIALIFVSRSEEQTSELQSLRH